MPPRPARSQAALALASVIVCVWPVCAELQTPADDYSKEPYVIERSDIKVAVDADGTQTRDAEVRVRIQSAAAVQQAGIIVLPYSRDLTTVDVKYVRARKPDGSVVETPIASAIDLPADMTRQAPTYTDVYLKQFNVRGLAVGDTLEYAFRMRSRSLVTGQFWIEQNWISEGIVLADDFEVTVPVAAAAKVKTIGDSQPTVETHAGLQTYRWHHANLKALSEKEVALRDFERRNQSADIRVSSFHDWADVGATVRELWRDRAQVTPPIRDKALELTRDLKTDEEKLAALYSFVSTKIRYVAISFGVGRIQPHPAAEVLENGFGDCKDQSTLLTALLAAVGLTAEPALIAPGVPVDADVPSISQFNHVVTLVTIGTRQTWMDTTLEVAPLGLLVEAERDVHALLIPTSGPARLIRTPATPSRPTSWKTDSVGTISDTGALDATVHEIVAGDLEVLFRAAFRTAPQSQWTEVVKKLPLPSRFGAAVSDLVVSPIEDTTTPLQLSYRLKADTYSDWATHQLSALVPFINYAQMPGADAPAVPLAIGGPIELVSTSRLTLPTTLAATLGPAAKPDIVLDQNFAHYHLENSLKGGIFETRREMQYKRNEITPDQFAAYRKFIGEFVAAEYAVDLHALGWAWGDEASIDWYGGETADTRKIIQDAAAAERRGEHQTAETALTDLTRAKPGCDKAWLTLAWATRDAGKPDEAIAILRKRVATSPTPDAYKLLAPWLPPAQAVDVWREGWQKFGKSDDEFALYLGEALVGAQKYGEAVSVLETQAQKQTKSGRFQWDLGRALLNDNKRDAGIAALRSSAELDPRPLTLNNVAWQFAIRSIALDDALSLATRAVKDTEERASRLTLTGVDADALGVMSSLGMYWDTLAWTHFKMGHLDEAERYQIASWDLMSEETYASHLSEIAAARHDQEASSLFAEIAVALRNPDRTAGLAAVTAILDRNAAKDAARGASQASHVSVPKGTATGNAEAYVLTGADGKITAVAFISGDATLRPQLDALRGLIVGARLPPSTAAKMLRRGTLSCVAGASECRFVLYPARTAAGMRQ